MQNNLQVVIPQSNQNQTGRNVLYVSDLPANAIDSDLWIFFDEFKENIVFLQLSSGTKTQEQFSKKIAKVIFKDTKTADEARKAKNMHKIKGKTIRVMWEERDNNMRYSSQANLFVKNIPFSVKPREFYELFLQFGDICSSKMPEDENGHLGYGYINYYSHESASAALNATSAKEIWGSKLEVTFFQKKNERFGGYGLNSNTSLYLKNFPLNYEEKEINALCSQYGEITSVKISQDDFKRKFAIVIFSKEESASKAKEGLNEKKIGDAELFADLLMNKQDRKKVLSSKIQDSNYRLNEIYKLCNLHIRNIPYHAKEEDLIEAFKKFGLIKSVKIEKYMLVTKVNNEMKEIPTSKGFGYVCFEDPESAEKALAEMNEKYLPKFETWKRPLIIEHFMPKFERNPVVQNKMNILSGTRNPMLGNPYAPPLMQGMPFPGFINPPMKPSRHFQQVKGPSQHIPKKKQESRTYIEKDDLDYNYLNSLDYESKKDYLGEFIFKKIENHKLSQSNSLPIDVIGKITGMIIGIDDINEIIDIYKNPDNLTSRISEALELITKN
jgi:RNA recognition motif-containing protein